MRREAQVNAEAARKEGQLVFCGLRIRFQPRNKCHTLFSVQHLHHTDERQIRKQEEKEAELIVCSCRGRPVNAAIERLMGKLAAIVVSACDCMITR